MLSLLLLELPISLAVEFLGRARSIIIGVLSLASSYIIYYLSSSLPTFMLAEIIAAFSLPLIAGPLEDWAKSSLEEKSSLSALEAWQKKKEGLEKIAAISGALIGFMIISISSALPWLLAAGAMLISAALALFYFPELEEQNIQINTKLSFIKRDLKKSWRKESRKRPSLKVFLVGSALAMGIQPLNMKWLALSRQKALLLPLSIGLFMSLVILIVAILIYLIPHILGRKELKDKSVAIALALIGIAILLSGHSRVLISALSFFFLHQIKGSFFLPLKQVFLNRYLVTNRKPLIFSLEAAIGQLAASLGLIGGSWIVLHYSVDLAWMISGIILIMLSPWLWQEGFKKEKEVIRHFAKHYCQKVASAPSLRLLSSCSGVTFAQFFRIIKGNMTNIFSTQVVNKYNPLSHGDFCAMIVSGPACV